MTTCVVIPWRGGDPHREAALAYVTARYDRLGLPWTLGPCPTQKWVKALAIEEALARSDAAAARDGRPCADVLVIADADVIVPNLQRAIDLLDEAPWAVPHTMVHRLTRQATVAALESGHLNGGMERPGPYVGKVGGGMVVLRRETYERVPLDPRFIGWGQEDESWGLALDAIAGPYVRLDEPLHHLWHPPQDRIDRRIGSFENRALWRRYQRAHKAATHGDRGPMEVLVGEALASYGNLTTP